MLFYPILDIIYIHIFTC